MTRPLHVATLLAVTAAAAPASAAAAWSSPESLLPAPPGGALPSAPQAFASGAGSLVVSSDGSRPWLARGDARGSFGAPTQLGTSAGGSTSSVDADVGDDGTLAVAWVGTGVVHVVVVPPGGAPGSQRDVAAAGTNGAAVAVAPDGGVTLAYRTRTGPTYGIDVVSAPPGGGFGAPVTLDSGTSGMDSPDVAAGPGGLAAVTYRKILTRYRARVAVRPAGAPAFEAPETLPGSDQAVIRTRVAAGGDGHVVVGWVDGAAQYATRAPGATSFGPPTALDGAAFTLNLAATPQGGTAAAWSGSGTLRAAVRPPGGAFAAPVTIGSSTSPIVSDPAIGVGPSGAATAVYADPGDGAVRVTDLGGGTTIVGYGAPAQANSPSIAVGSSLAVAAWRDVTGGISAATRSDVAVPGSPGSAPAGPDRRRPRLTIVTRSRTVRVTRRTKQITLRVRCDEACSFSATADMTTRRGSRLAHAPLRPYTAKSARPGTRSIRLGLWSLARKDLLRALSAGRGANLSIDLTASDRAGNTTRRIVRLRLRGR